MPQRTRRKNLLEISNQPELWIFSNLLAEKWINENNLEEPVFERRVTMPFSLPSGSAIFKIESEGTQGDVISFSIAHSSEIYLIQLLDPAQFLKFKQTVLSAVETIYNENFNFFSYLKPYFLPKLREFGVMEVLGDTPIQDLADYGVKSRILQRISDPVQGYEVPQYWRVNRNLEALQNKELRNENRIFSLRSAICDRLAKHAVIESLRCAVITLKRYADLLDSMTSESKIEYSDEYLELADGLYQLGEFQDSAVFYSKCLSHSNFEHKEEEVRNKILAALKSSIEQLEPQEFLEYAIFAARVARGHEEN